MTPIEHLTVRLDDMKRDLRKAKTNSGVYYSDESIKRLEESITQYEIAIKKLEGSFKKNDNINDLINSIHIDKGNLEFIAQKGKINGTLAMEIKRIMQIYAS